MNQQAYLPALLKLNVLSRLLVVTAGHIGNSIFCTPAIRLLRDALPAHASLDVVALNAASADVFAGNDAISRVYTVRSTWRMALLASRYDRVICLHPKSASLLTRVTVPVSVIPSFDSHRHYAEQILEFASALVGRALDDDKRRYELLTADCGKPLSAMCSHAPRIGIHLGCGRTAIHGWKFFYRKRDSHPKLWPTENYIALAEQLRRIFPNASFVLTGTRNERFLARRFTKMFDRLSTPDHAVTDLTGGTSVRELAGIIDGLDLFITQDCGVLHVAAATSTPLLALFGPTCPALTGPWPLASQHRILQRESMTDITPDMAADAAIALLQKYPAPVPDIARAPRKKTWRDLFVAGVLSLQPFDLLSGGYNASIYAGLL